jgi:hypothetical protein
VRYFAGAIITGLGDTCHPGSPHRRPGASLGAPAFAATYSLDAAAGDDGRAGSSEATAWKTLAKVNATVCQPGDGILLKSGAAWTGQLSPKGSGADGRPIRVGRYGSGAKPRIAANGAARSAVYLPNQAYWEIQDLEITDSGASPADRRGIWIAGRDFGVIRHIHIRNCDVHDVNGDVKWDNGDGLLLCQFPFGDCVVRYNILQNNTRYQMYLHSDTKGVASIYNNVVGGGIVYDDNAYFGSSVTVPAGDARAIRADPKFADPGRALYSGNPDVGAHGSGATVGLKGPVIRKTSGPGSKSGQGWNDRGHYRANGSLISGEGNGVRLSSPERR